MRAQKKSQTARRLAEAVIETMEQRQLLSVTLGFNMPYDPNNPVPVGPGDLFITGTPGDDIIIISLDPGDPNTLVIDDNVDFGGQSYTFDKRALSYEVRRIVVQGFEGNDQLIVDESNGAIRFPFSIDGGDGDDTIFGGSGNDVIVGGTGSDSLVGGNGMDFISGGDGFDTIYGSANPDDLDFDGNPLYGKNPNQDAMNSVRGGNDDDLIVGGPKNDRLYGDNGNDTILGMAGNDYIEGNNDDDSIDGGAGFDTIHGNNGDDSIDGGAHNDFLFGDNGNDTIFGNFGNDQIFGGAGDDELHGDAGNDSLDGGAGNDFLFGEAGKDRFKISGRWGQAELLDFEPSERDSIGNFVNLSTKIRKN